MAKSPELAAKRERWRADLNELEALALRRAGLAGWQAKDEEAALRRAYADLIVERSNALDGFVQQTRAAKAYQAEHPEMKLRDCYPDPDVVRHFRDVDAVLCQVRQAWRDIDAAFHGVEGQDVRVKAYLQSIGVNPERAPLIRVRHAGQVAPLIEPTDDELEVLP